MMAKAKQLSKRQHAVIKDLFGCELGEQAVLEKYKVSRHLYSKWLADEAFAEQFDQRIAGAYHQSVALIARYAPLAASKLVQLTESEKEETARKACLDIISMQALVSKNTQQSAQPKTSDCLSTHQLSEQTAGRLLAVLAEEKNDQ
ncbi:MAG: hypothetical protein ACYTFW_10475 [Planctomycetota bacterium]